MTHEPRQLLLNPGPVTLTPRVRAALAREDLCHREPEYAVLHQDVVARLARVYPQAARTHVPILLTGSGTAAVEAMVGSLVPANGKALVLCNGVYGERMVSMLETQHKAVEPLRWGWTERWDVTAVEKALDANRSITHVLGVHHETTTGRLNAVAQVGRVCRARNVAFLLDAVSSFGAEDIQFDEWNLEACAATGNKCLHGVPGIAFVLARRKALEERGSGATCMYLDLHRYWKEAASGQPPFTPAVHVMFALQEALKEFEEEGGQPHRLKQYQALAHQVMQGLASMGITVFLESPDVYSSVLVSYRVPEGVSYATLHDRLKDAGFVIYAGQGQFHGTIFRISTMGDVGSADMERLLSVIGDVLKASPSPSFPTTR